MYRSVRSSTLLLAASLLTTPSLACFDTGEGTDIPEEKAAIDGRIESSQGVSAQTSATASTVAAARVEADGSLTVLAEADVRATGDFTIREVPVGMAGLQVVAYSETEAEVGRTLVHGETADEVTITVAPVTPEATVEGDIHARLTASGEASAAENSGGLALFVRLDDSEANLLLASETELDAYAAAYARAEAWTEASLGALSASFDHAARLEVLTSAAIDYASARDGGTDTEMAHEAMIEAVIDGHVAGGVDLEALALVTATASAGADKGASDSSGSARLEAVREATRVNLRTRERLAASAEGAPADGGLEVEAVLASARAEVMAATSVAEIEAALDAASDASSTILVDGIVQASGGLDLGLQTQVEAAVATLFTDLDLGADLVAAGSAEDAAQAAVDFRSDVQAEVDGLVQLLDGVLTLDAEAVTELVIAARAGGTTE